LDVVRLDWFKFAAKVCFQIGFMNMYDGPIPNRTGQKNL